MRCLASGIVLALALSGSARAAEPQRVDRSGAWTVYRIGSGSARECFAHAAPSRSEGKYKQRGEVMLQVTHRPGQRVRDELSFTAGYTYRPDSSVKLDIDGRVFELFTHGDRAYARDAATDRALADAMKRGRNLRVRGTSSRGTATTDHFSLSGFTRAHQSLDKACSD